MRKFYLIILLTLSTGISPLCGQFTNVMIHNSSDPEEPSISFNPISPNELVAGSNNRNSYHSNDGGATWITGTISSTYSEAGDPCLVADSLGNCYYFHLVNSVDRVVCQKSTNSGTSYNNGAYTWNNNLLFQDKEWATVDLHTNNVYVTWTQYDNGFNPGPQDSSRIYFAKSTDQGASFTDGLRINHIAGDCLYKDITDPHPFVGPNGELYVTFMDSAGIRFNKSLDAGNTWLSVQPLIASVGSMRYDSVQGVTRIRTMPYPACDVSNSAYRGNLYVSWADQRNGPTNSDIFFIKSSNGGTNWSTPLKVNSDNSNHQQYRNAMTVDQANGYLYIVYYDRRNYVNNDSSDVYLAKSTDGGSSWTDYKISSSGFINTSNLFDGDYIDISANAGRVRPIWTRVDNFFSSIWTCLYDETTLGIPVYREAINNAHFTVNPNPANIVATVSFMNEVENLEGTVSDASGRIVKTFKVNHEREKTLDLRYLPAGMYFVRAGVETKKLIVEK